MQISLTNLALAVVLSAKAAFAICPGYNFGIADLGGGPIGSWRVYDASCNSALTVITDNPCTSGSFDCSPAPIKITGLHLNGQNYKCRGDANAGSCAGHGIQVCCRNDGN
ncbi:hypothetical protein CYLTODRAFT_421117 [Cylindrobasidium torrendii FP15055 ss-10]|uniref:Cyanovirin-N domain-containing protein n=1 Tax=Cylindrobasidium torrendii FP15055 ss-10 TaxID=1314674 RepID=A0A0D7BEL3_9AGAR|nr:hypothetical protein CYLTODRAFT_421117 [Cylindrobasidium torrendii FP15055 ss-10]